MKYEFFEVNAKTKRVNLQMLFSMNPMKKPGNS